MNNAGFTQEELKQLNKKDLIGYADESYGVKLDIKLSRDKLVRAIIELQNNQTNPDSPGIDKDTGSENNEGTKNNTEAAQLKTESDTESDSKETSEQNQQDDKPKIRKKDSYSFPTRSRCPRCGAIETEAYRTDGKVQYRRCRRAVCRINYQVIGTKV